MSYFSGVPIGKEANEILSDVASDGMKQLNHYLGVAPEVTTVLYAPGDSLGLAAALASLIPIGLCLALLAVFLARRSAEDLWVGAGQIGCEIVNGILKRVIRQSRPDSPVINMPVDSFGMPSAHSQYMGYFATIMILQSVKARNISIGHRLVRIFAAILISTFTAYSRYYLHYHTVAQVVTGYLVGAILGVFWFGCLYMLRSCGLLRWGLNLWPCRLLLIKDTDYSVLEEYNSYRKSLHETKEKSE